MTKSAKQSSALLPLDSEQPSVDAEQPTFDYEVGYGKPPAHTKFKKGQSGNPRGRPKGSIGFAQRLQQELREKITISENGRQRTVTKIVAASKQLVNRAVQGDIQYLRMLVAMAQTIDAAAAGKASTATVDLTDASLLAPLRQQLERGSHLVLSPAPSESTTSSSDDVDTNGTPTHPKQTKSES